MIPVHYTLCPRCRVYPSLSMEFETNHDGQLFVASKFSPASSPDKCSSPSPPHTQTSAHRDSAARRRRREKWAKAWEELAAEKTAAQVEQAVPQFLPEIVDNQSIELNYSSRTSSPPCPTIPTNSCTNLSSSSSSTSSFSAWTPSWTISCTSRSFYPGSWTISALAPRNTTRPGVSASWRSYSSTRWWPMLGDFADQWLCKCCSYEKLFDTEAWGTHGGIFRVQ